MLSTISVTDLPQLTQNLDQASRAGEKGLPTIFPASTVVALFDKLRRLLETQPTLVEVRLECALRAQAHRHTRKSPCWSPCLPSCRHAHGCQICALQRFLRAVGECCGPQVQPGSPEAKVTVVGDTHGQFHDVVTL